MERRLIAAAAQMGPVPLADSRESTVNRLIGMLESSAADGAELVVFTEVALTAFFPHWFIEDPEELRAYYETDMPNPTVAPLFERAHELGVAFVLGYAERDPDDRLFNTAVFVDESSHVALKYRKVHLPGFKYVRPGASYQNLEKRYFEVGDLGFGVTPWRDSVLGLGICNDRRWAEPYRVLALQGAEIMCLGYNTPDTLPQLPEGDALIDFHNHLSMQAGAYQNAMWVIGAAKAGVEEGVSQIGGSCIISPAGEIVAQASTLGDEVVLAELDLDMVTRYRRDVFNFDHHRRPESYGRIVEGISEDRHQPDTFDAATSAR